MCASIYNYTCFQKWYPICSKEKYFYFDLSIGVALRASLQFVVLITFKLSKYLDVKNFNFHSLFPKFHFVNYRPWPFRVLGTLFTNTLYNLWRPYCWQLFLSDELTRKIPNKSYYQRR